MLSRIIASKGTSLTRGYSRSIPDHITNSPLTQISTLPNGIRVATQSFPSETASVGVYVNSGSAFEDPQNNGVAHFLEHMIFKGTKTRTKQSIEYDIENIGGSLNAYTSREQTAYFSKIFRPDAKFAVDLLGDMIQNARLDQEEIEKERYTILREKEEVERTKDEIIADHLHSVAFQTSPLGKTILGPEANIKTISREALETYVKTHYTGERLVIVGTGGVEHNAMVDYVANSFGKIQSGNGKILMNRPKDVYSGALVTVGDTHSDEVHISIGFEGASWSDPNILTLLVVQNIIGSFDSFYGAGQNSSSRLAELFATEHLAERFSTFNGNYTSTGILGTYLKTNYHATEDAICEIITEYVRIGHSATDGEVARAKKRLLSSTLNYLEGSTSTCDHIGRQILSYGRYISPAELYLRINDITTEDVRRVARQYFTDQCPSVAAIGNCHLFPDYNQIRGWTYWNRL